MIEYHDYDKRIKSQICNTNIIPNGEIFHKQGFSATLYSNINTQSASRFRKIWLVISIISAVIKKRILNIYSQNEWREHF